MDSGIKKGCIGFIAAILVIAVGAGVSISLRGKSMKPKARALIAARNAKTLDKIRNEYTTEISAEGRARFEAAYGKFVTEVEKKDGENRTGIEAAAGDLTRIREDAKITPAEADEWIDTVEKELK